MPDQDEYFNEVNRQLSVLNKAKTDQAASDKAASYKAASDKAAADAAAKAPITTGQLIHNAGSAVKNATTNADLSSLSDPRVAAMIPGAAIGAYKSGASFNPLNPDFLKYLPKQGTPVQPTTAPQPLAFKPPASPIPIYDEAVGNKMLTSNWGLNQGIARAQQHGQSMGDAARIAQGLEPENVVGRAGPMVATNQNIMVPLDTARQMQNAQDTTHATTSAAQAAAPSAAEESGGIAGALGRYFPGAVKAANWAKGALPVAGAIAKGAGGAFGAVDSGLRVANKDYLGAGISALGTVAPFIAAPEIAIPATLGAAGINYLRDHPDTFKDITAPTNFGPTNFQFEN